MERTLEQWLDYQLHTHPQQIAMGLERVREVAIRMRLGRAGRHVITVDEEVAPAQLAELRKIPGIVALETI